MSAETSLIMGIVILWLWIIMLEIRFKRQNDAFLDVIEAIRKLANGAKAHNTNIDSHRKMLINLYERISVLSSELSEPPREEENEVIVTKHKKQTIQ